MILTSGKDKHTAIKIYVFLCPFVWQTRVIASLSLDIWLLTVWCGHKRCWWHPDVNDAGDATQKLGWDALILSAERVRCQHHSSICIMPSIITFSLIIPRNPISILFTASSSDYHKSPDRDLSDVQTFYHYLLSGRGTKKAVSRFSIKHQQISQLFLSFVETCWTLNNLNFVIYWEFSSQQQTEQKIVLSI